MHKNCYRLLLATILLAAVISVPAVSSPGSPDDILVIVNKSTAVDAISLDELEQIFLKKKTTWPNGQRIVTINTMHNSPLREIFRSKVLEMKADEEATYWEKQKIRRQIERPPEMVNTTKAVFKLKSAISYAFRKDIPANVVKTVLVIPK